MEEVKQDFLESLKDLTFNSRPIIQALTDIARECADYGQAVAEAIEIHLSRCTPPLKLPALYLMDSIVKNCRVPYADVFASKVYRMFTETFRHSQPPIRKKLGDLFKTWTIPVAETGRPLFPPEILGQIDQFLQQQSAPPQQNNNQGRVNVSLLTVGINRLVTQLNSLPKDSDAEYQLSVLQRMQSALSGQAVDQQVLERIQHDLEKVKARVAHLASKKQRGPQRQQNQRKNQKDKKPYNRDPNKPATGANAEPIRNRIDFASLAKSLGSRDSTPETRQNTASSVPGTAGNPMFPSDLLSSLKSAGLLPDTKNIVVELTNASINTPHPELIALLYSSEPLQCQICGKRFPDTPEGERAREEELDWHFRVNKDLREGRSRSRLWFLTAEQWIEYDDAVDDPADGAAIEDESEKVDLNAEAKKYVPIPDGAEEESCPICQEKFNSVWSEEAEEWVWQNAVEVQNCIMHATCYADPHNKAAVEAVLMKVKEES